MHLLTSSNRIVDQNLFTNWHNYKYNFTFHEKPSRQVFLHLMPISVWFKLQTPFLVFLQWTTGTYVKRNLLIWTEITNGLENQIFWLSKKLDFFGFWCKREEESLSECKLQSVFSKVQNWLLKVPIVKITFSFSNNLNYRSLFTTNFVFVITKLIFVLNRYK